ncbi:hypothetical protein ACFFU9_10375 [Mariniflexile ostreae]|uniref:Uncharacterized protein n=1 Tax=Mariniflexile ostreae TaxID=1520892 RepID=A0ABV5FCH8_9FLAO
MELVVQNSNVEMVHKYNSIELKGWINQLEYIDREIDNFLNLYASDVVNDTMPKAIQYRFLKRKDENKHLYETVLAYSESYYAKAMAPHDMACDMVYLEEYNQLRKSYEYHLEKYRRVKDILFSKALRKVHVDNAS